MPLRLAHARTDALPIDLAGVTPDALVGAALADVQRLPVRHGNRAVELGELFAISGDTTDLAWQFEGDLSAVHNLGAGMTRGEVLVDGPVGHRAGAQMRGGRLEIRGDAGDYVGAQMHGGAVHVRGAAGDHAGAALPGSPRGMTGGALLVDGHAGRQLGARMRRGLIAAAGAGAHAADHMLAGTILVFGPCGPEPGAAMRRGTIGIIGARLPALLPTFRHGCRAPLAVLGLLARELRRHDYAPLALDALRGEVELHHGDLAELGRGEIAWAPLAGGGL